jgi:TonB family protein
VGLALCAAGPGLLAFQGRLTLSVDPQHVLKWARIIEGVPVPKSTREVLPVRPSVLPPSIDGRVTIRVTVGKDGTVKDANIVTHMALFDAAALAGVRQWRFEPVLINGAPVDVVLSKTVTFPKDRGPITISDTPPAIEVPCPKLIKQVDPSPSASTIPVGTRGRIFVEVVIASSGKVKGAQVLHGVSPSIDEAALDAVRQWTYEQTMVNGMPMEVVMVVVINVSS